MKLLKIAHRGAKNLQPENTLIAFETAIKNGADMIELDVRLSADKELVVFHDESIDRMTNREGFVNGLTLSELKQFKIKNQHEIPTLEEVFDLVKNTISINIELKEYKCVEKVVFLIEKYVSENGWTYDSFLISSFDWNALQQVKFLNEKIPIGVLTETDLDLAFAFAKFIKAKSIHPYFHLLNQENVKKCQEKDILVLPWTVNEITDIEYLKSINVNGIITDFLERL